MATEKQNKEPHPELRIARERIAQLTETGQQLNSTAADFLRIEGETALTFTGLALDTHNPEKRKRNRQNARKAYDTIIERWDTVTFTPQQEAYILEMLSRLKNELALLGEKL